MSTLFSDTIKLARENPELAPTLLPILKAAATGGRYFKTRDLPVALFNALRDVRYGKSDILVSPREKYRVQSMGGDGYQSFVVAVDLGTGRTKEIEGSWGGPSINDPYNQVDRDDTEYPLPYNGAVIVGSRGGGHPTYAEIYVHPDNLQKLLPGGEVEVTDNEVKVLQIIKAIKSSYRGDEFSRNGLGLYSKSNPLIVGLAGRGLLKITGAGVMITDEGKNIAISHPRMAGF